MIPSLALLASCSASKSKQAPKKVALHWNTDLPSTFKKVGIMIGELGWWLGQAVSTSLVSTSPKCLHPQDTSSK